MLVLGMWRLNYIRHQFLKVKLETRQHSERVSAVQVLFQPHSLTSLRRNDVSTQSPVLASRSSIYLERGSFAVVKRF